MADTLYKVRVKLGDSPAKAVAAVRKQLIPPRPEPESLSAEADPLPVTVVGSRAFGMRLLLERVWSDLGMAAAFERYALEHGLRFPLERVVFGMVLNRLVDPKSKRACDAWLKDLAYFPEWDEKWGVQHFFRARDVFHDEWADVESILFEALWERIPEEARAFLLVDTTSKYFEMRDPMRNWPKCGTSIWPRLQVVPSLLWRRCPRSSTSRPSGCAERTRMGMTAILKSSLPQS